MRCPKCGYISFDHLASCKKCNKDISEASENLDGTIFAVAVPLFLDIEHQEDEAQGEEVEESLEDEVAVEDIEMLDEGGDDVVLEDDAGLDEFEVLDDLEDEAMTLDDVEEVSLDDEITFEDDEITLDFGAEGEDETASAGGSDENDGLQLDFAEIDISDLAPPETEQEGVVESETLTLEEEPFADAALVGGAPPASDFVAPGSGLEDLQVEGLDLQAPAPLVAGSKVGNKLMPSVKTGTALDDFEVDLGDLISGGE